MSVYRNPGPNAFGDFNVQPAQPANESTKQSGLPKSEAELRAEQSREEVGKSKRGRGEPLNTPLPRTLAWAAQLPPNIQPHELIRLYARIANQLAGDWDEPDATRAYFKRLLVSQRGNRRGFPKQVESELAGLLLHYELLHPERGSVIGWQEVWKG
jgi:hypothetical protein